MKWTDLILLGGAVVGGYLLSNALTGDKQAGISPFKTDQGMQTFFDKGGSYTSTEQGGFPWASGFFGGLGILGGMLEGFTSGTTEVFDGGNDNTGGASTKSKSSRIKTGGAMRPKGYYRTSPAKTIQKVQEATNLKHNVKVGANIIRNIPMTITEEEGVFQPSTVARLVSRAKYGTFGGR